MQEPSARSGSLIFQRRLTDLSRDRVKSVVADAEPTKAPVKPLSVAQRLQAAE